MPVHAAANFKFATSRLSLNVSICLHYYISAQKQCPASMACVILTENKKFNLRFDS